jgi:hypothetical protein
MKNGRISIYPEMARSKRKPIRNDMAISDPGTSAVIRLSSLKNKIKRKIVKIDSTDRYIKKNCRIVVGMCFLKVIFYVLKFQGLIWPAKVKHPSVFGNNL